jgi:hypothetical protein
MNSVTVLWRHATLKARYIDTGAHTRVVYDVISTVPEFMVSISTQVHTLECFDSSTHAPLIMPRVKAADVSKSLMTGFVKQCGG